MHFVAPINTRGGHQQVNERGRAKRQKIHEQLHIQHASVFALKDENIYIPIQVKQDIQVDPVVCLCVPSFEVPALGGQGLPSPTVHFSR